jgi:deoxycytidylate deaminase
MINSEDIYSTLYEEASKSPCTIHKYGALICQKGIIISKGHANIPTLKNEGNCPDCPRAEIALKSNVNGDYFDYCYVVHAEIEVLIKASSQSANGKRSLYLLGLNPDGSIYKNAFPCISCLRTILSSGIMDLYVYIDEKTIMHHDLSKSKNQYHINTKGVADVIKLSEH